MMYKNRKLISSLFFILLLIGCNKVDIEDPSGAFLSENFIQTYIIPESITLQIYNSDYIQVQIQGKEIRNSYDPHKELYKIYSEKYGDENYNRKLVPGTNVVVGEQIESILIICDKDLDKEHPAGTPLNDIIKLCATSPENYIQNKYVWVKTDFPEEFDELVLNTFEGNYPIFQYLSELTDSDMTLLNYRFYLNLPQHQLKEKLTFTVEITVSGKVISSQITFLVD